MKDWRRTKKERKKERGGLTIYVNTERVWKERSPVNQEKMPMRGYGGDHGVIYISQSARGGF